MAEWGASRSGGTWRSIGRAIAGAAAVLLASVAYVWLTLPDVRPLRAHTPSTTAFMNLRRAEALAAGQRVSVSHRFIRYNRISPALVRAVLVAEDSAFFAHDGIDYDELKESLEINFERGQLIRGASTITQQLAKNLYLSPSRTPARKLREWLITRRLEAELPKTRILELYLNLIEWGNGIWGAEAASLQYFGISASQLSAEQAALLAAAIINPRVYSPARPNARLLRRQKIILDRMERKIAPVEKSAPQSGG